MITTLVALSSVALGIVIGHFLVAVLRGGPMTFEPLRKPTPPPTYAPSPAKSSTGRYRLDVMAETPRSSFRFTEADLALIDKGRGRMSRTNYLRKLVRADVNGGGRKRKSKVKPTRQFALEQLASHAEHDPRAAERLLEAVTADEQLERLRGLTTD